MRQDNFPEVKYGPESTVAKAWLATDGDRHGPASTLLQQVPGSRFDLSGREPFNKLVTTSA